MTAGSSTPTGGPHAAIVLAGGAGRRLGGVDKPGLDVGGVRLIDRALAAVAGVPHVVVVGAPRDLPAGARQVREDPPGSGPAAAAAAGIAALPDLSGSAVVVLLAADLPAVTGDTLARLVDALAARPDAPGAVLLAGGRRQYLLGAWRCAPLRARVAARPSWAGARLAELLDPLDPVELPAAGSEAEDIDTPEDLRRWRRQ